MTSPSERPTNEQTRTYYRASSVVFLKTDAPFGGLSNMAGGFPLHVQGTRIYTSEALYQACRFPHLPEIQQLIIGQASPMTAKMKSKPYRKDSRPDWDRVRVKVMRWCLRVKLAQNWAKFIDLLLRTGERPIVEESRRDDFWGAKPVDEQTLVGMNVLGRLLMELREAGKAQGPAGFRAVEPLDIPEFLIFGRPIGTVGAHELGARDAASPSTACAPDGGLFDDPAEQGSLFDAPAAREGPAPAYVTSPTAESARLSELRTYPRMKDSAVPWLGEVPEHWDVRRGKWLFRSRKDLNSDLRNTNILSLTLRGVVNNDPDDPEGLVPKDYSTYQVFEKNDLVFKLIDLENIRTSRVGLVHEEGIMSPAYVRLVRTHSGNQLFFFQQYFDLYQRGIFNQLGAGVRSTLSAHDLLEVPVLGPPTDEQAAIVRFLDHADRRIRRHIRAKQKLIKLLEEQKRAIIHRAVTRGLDPNVRLKPSGVEWLGDVPEHWEVARLGRLIELVTGFPFKSNGFTQDPEDIRLLRGVNISPGKIRWTDVVRWPMSERDKYSAFELQVGDVVLGMDRPLIQSGTRVAMVTEPDIPALLLQRVARIRPRDELQSEFLALLLAGKSFADYLTPIFTGISVPHLSPEQIKSFCFALPTDSEQREIVRWTEEKTRKTDVSTSNADREIQLLREYRTRLIADVVTGKLDVREAAARLPQEAEDLEPLDEAEVEDDSEEGDAGDTDGVPEETEA